ncbi:MAG: efflux RND transporter periplasmic adaptor subunit [Bacteroidaceae bacterium]|nr:efflux RND transporter periplasmic adaptor subunit [Bacteroidaceae bacterium]MBR1522002.1 efflux RND transporter periplasmic adaptor subunit [Bacteroidaceae bacterium]
MKINHIFATIILASTLAACSEGTKVTYSTAPVEKQNISTSITATGTIEPVTEVEVGTQVSGIIDKIYVDYNSEVHKGQVIAELDKTNLLSELASAQSNLSNSQSSLNYQTANYKRYKTLFEKGLVSANDYENAKLTYEQAVQQVKVQQQNVQKAQTNLGYATITSPIDGIVLSKEVEEGQTVASAMTTPTLFIIAQDLTDMRVIADIDEADIGGVKEGQRVTFTVDAFPDDTFEGAVTQVRQEATTESNVVTYEVVISAPNDHLKLKPGLTANVTIYTLEKNGVLAVPSRALRFTPNEALLTETETVEDVEAPAKVWTKEGNTFKAHKVETGTTNGTLTEIVSGVAAGTEVLTDFEIIGGKEESAEEQASNPFMPRPRNNNKNGNNKKQ